jgi:hypothetical protein
MSRGFGNNPIGPCPPGQTRQPDGTCAPTNQGHPSAPITPNNPIVGGGVNPGGGGGGPYKPAGCNCDSYTWGGTFVIAPGAPQAVSGNWDAYLKAYAFAQGMVANSGQPVTSEITAPFCNCGGGPGPNGGPSAPSGPTQLPPPSQPPCNTCGGQTSGGSCPTCCDSQIASATKPLTDAIASLISQIGHKQSDACDMSDSCIEAIYNKVMDKLAPPTMTCNQCCSALQSGVELTVAQAAECASCACSNAEQICSPGQPETWGQPCTGCGQEPCCCNEGICEPCETEPSSVMYTAWCNPTTGETAVTKTGDAEFGPPWSTFGTFPVLSQAELAAIDGCRKSQSQQASVPYQIPQPGSVNSTLVCDINTFSSPGNVSSYLSGLHPANLGTVGANVLRGVADSVSGAISDIPVLGPLFAPIVQASAGPLFMGPLMAPIAAKMLGCADGTAADALTQLTFLNMAGSVSGTNYAQFASPLNYAVNATCRNRHLEPERAIAAWLGGSIDDGQLDTHFAIAGYCEQSVSNYKFAARSKWVPDQIIDLNNRGFINSSQADTLLRQLGYMEKQTRDGIIALGQQVPPYSDIVRMMVRDADDQSLVDRFGLDTDFTKKYQSQLQAWAKAQGVPDKVMQYLWRAHWSIPAPGQLFEIYHRLRDPNVQQAQDQTYQDVITALEQQDIAPFWIPKLLAISFRPLTRIDIRRAYQIGAIDDDTVKQSLRNIGYDDTNVGVMFGFMQKLRDQGAATDRLLKLWTGFRINSADLEARMRAKGYQDAAIKQAMLDSEMSFTTSAPALAFVEGELSSQQLSLVLGQWGVSQDGVAKVVSTLGYRVKWHEAIGEYQAGLVNRQDAIDAMTNDGVSAARAEKWLKGIDNKLAIKHAQSCEANVKRRFKYGDLTADQVTQTLVAQGVTAERAENLEDWWGCEAVTDVRHITANRLCGWLARGSIGPQDFVDRLTKIGYSKSDAINLLSDCVGKTGVQQQRQAVALAKQEQAALLKAERQAARNQAALLRQQQQAAKLNQQRALERNRREKQLMSAGEKLSAKCDCSFEDALNTATQSLATVRQQYGLTVDEAMQVLTQSVEEWPGGDPATLAEYMTGFAQLVTSNAGQDAEADVESAP